MYQSLQGNLVLGRAISYFVSQGIPVSIPLNDTQKYDLVADIDGRLCKISVKTSRNTNNGISYSVQLRNTGGNRTGEVRQVAFDNTTCDYVFVYLINEKIYLIPADKIEAKNSITVGNKYAEYEITNKSFFDFINGSVAESG